MIPSSAMFARHRPVPDLLSAAASPAGGNLCAAEGTWTHTITWALNNPDDELYQIDIEVATNLAGDNWVGLVGGLLTSDGPTGYLDDTGLEGNTGGVDNPTTHYRKYRVRLIRKAGSVLIETQDTTQGSITFYTDACA